MLKVLILLIAIFTGTAYGQVKQKQNPSDFLPKGYVLFDQIKGDLNKDGIEDCILIIKGTDTGKIVLKDDSIKVDRNRRGIIILFGKGDHYELAAKNNDCFSSENGDGGINYVPELSVEIIRGNLIISFEHVLYGFWQYKFRYQHSDFELIGYDDTFHHGPVIEIHSINFLTKKKMEKSNSNEYIESGSEVFKKTWKDIAVTSLIKLSEIKDFDNLDITLYQL